MNQVSDLQREILDILQEECSEVIQAASKIKRFGVDCQENKEDLIKEIADLEVLLNLTKQHVLQQFNSEDHRFHQGKIEKLKVYTQEIKKIL